MAIFKKIKGYMRLATKISLALRSAADFQLAKSKWRSMNPHNHTIIANLKGEQGFPFDKVSVGNGTYGPLRVIPFSKSDGRLVIGSYCSIAAGVCFLLGGEHRYNLVSTYPFRYYTKGLDEATSKGDIVVEDDVWIGHSSLILSGVTLARGTVVAAGSVVVKSTEPYSIVGGNPARLIKKRFPDNVVRALSAIDYSRLTPEAAADMEALLYDDKISGYSDGELTDFVRKIKYRITPPINI